MTEIYKIPALTEQPQVRLGKHSKGIRMKKTPDAIVVTYSGALPALPASKIPKTPTMEWCDKYGIPWYELIYYGAAKQLMYACITFDAVEEEKHNE